MKCSIQHRTTTTTRLWHALSTDFKQPSSTIGRESTDIQNITEPTEALIRSTGGPPLMEQYALLDPHLRII
nr:hypothetical protein Q903MT_gene6605 [Picea sitchensis]